MESDPGFDRKIRERLAGLGQSRGACPDSEALTRYALGQMAEDEAAAIRRHVSVCGMCDLVLERMKPFDRPEVESGWQRLRFFRHPALGWAFAILLAIPAWRAWRAPEPAHPEVSRPIPMAAPLPKIRSLSYMDLNRTRGTAKATAAGSGPAVLDFLVPAVPGATYTAVLRSGGVEVRQPISSWNGIGAYYLLVEDPTLLMSGCELAVEERGPTGKTRNAATFDCSR